MTADRLLQIKQEEVIWNYFNFSYLKSNFIVRFDECKSNYR